jgi:hypothetical protein
MPDHHQAGLPEVPQMGSVAGFEPDQETAPLRISGFFSLVFGFLSVLSLLARPLLILPLVALTLGLITLRPSTRGRPVGTTPAIIGMVMAAAFGACGFTFRELKQSTLRQQAEYFSRQYLELIARDEMELAAEVRKAHVNRFAEEMPLKTFYQTNEEAAGSLEEFREEGVNTYVQSMGPDGAWKLDRTPRVYHRFGHDRVQVVWRNTDDPSSRKIEVTMELRIDPETGDSQWHVTRCQYLIDELIVADSVL